MDEILKLILHKIEKMSSDIDELKGMRSDIHELKEGQQRLEDRMDRMQSNIIESIGTYTDKIPEHADSNIEALNRRLFLAEADIQRLNKR